MRWSNQIIGFDWPESEKETTRSNVCGYFKMNCPHKRCTMRTFTIIGKTIYGFSVSPNPPTMNIPWMNVLEWMREILSENVCLMWETVECETTYHRFAKILWSTFPIHTETVVTTVACNDWQPIESFVIIAFHHLASAIISFVEWLRCDANDLNAVRLWWCGEIVLTKCILANPSTDSVLTYCVGVHVWVGVVPSKTCVNQHIPSIRCSHRISIELFARHPFRMGWSSGPCN